MEPSEDVLARLDRIGDLDRSGAAPGELIGELRELIREAGAGTRDWRAAEHEAVQAAGNDGEEVVGRSRTALARDIIG